MCRSPTGWSRPENGSRAAVRFRQPRRRGLPRTPMGSCSTAHPTGTCRSGAGIHSCPGRPLAKAEIGRGDPTMLRRLPGFHIDGEVERTSPLEGGGRQHPACATATRDLVTGKERTPCECHHRPRQVLRLRRLRFAAPDNLQLGTGQRRPCARREPGPGSGRRAGGGGLPAAAVIEESDDCEAAAQGRGRRQLARRHPCGGVPA